MCIELHYQMTDELISVASEFCEHMPCEHMAVHGEVYEHTAGEHMAVHSELCEHMAVLGTPGLGAFRQERSTGHCGVYCISI